MPRGDVDAVRAEAAAVGLHEHDLVATDRHLDALGSEAHARSVDENLGALGGLTWALAIYEYGEAKDASTMQGYDPNTDPHAEKLERYVFIGDLLLIGGGALLGTGIVLWYLQKDDHEPSDSIAVSAAPTDDGGMVFVRWQR